MHNEHNATLWWRRINTLKKNTPFSAFIIPGTKIVNFPLKRYFCAVMLRLQSNPINKDTSLILGTVCFVPGERKPLHFLYIQPAPVYKYKLSRLISIHFQLELVKRIWYQIKAFPIRWLFYWVSLHFPLIMYWFCWEKLDFVHSWDLKR